MFLLFFEKHWLRLLAFLVLVAFPVGILLLQSNAPDEPEAEKLKPYVPYQARKYIADMKAYYTKRQELSDAWRTAKSEFDALLPEQDPYEYLSGLTASERKTLGSQMQRANEKVEQAWKRLREFRTTRPVPPKELGFSNE